MGLLGVALAVVTLHIPAPWILLIAGALIPALTAVVTKDLGGLWEATVLAVLTAVNGVVAQAVGHDGSFPLVQTLSSIGWATLVTLLAHYGYSIPHGLQRISRSTAAVGFGRRRIRHIPPHGAAGHLESGTEFFGETGAPPAR